MERRRERVYLGIGSNLGNRRDNIDSALSFLKDIPHLEIIKVSSLYETEPVGGPPQGKFLNAVIVCVTTIPAQKLIDCLKTIEKRMGRKAGRTRWAARIIDIDILLYGRRIIKTEKLTVPHPLMHERFFVLRPFLELAPGAVHPVFKKTVKKLFDELEKKNEKTVSQERR